MLACSPRSHEVTPRASAYALSRQAGDGELLFLRIAQVLTKEKYNT